MVSTAKATASEQAAAADSASKGAGETGGGVAATEGSTTRTATDTSESGSAKAAEDRRNVTETSPARTDTKASKASKASKSSKAKADGSAQGATDILPVDGSTTGATFVDFKDVDGDPQRWTEGTNGTVLRGHEAVAYQMMREGGTTVDAVSAATEGWASLAKIKAAAKKCGRDVKVGDDKVLRLGARLEA